MADFEISEWEDVKPIPLDEGPHPVVSIAYTEECKFFVFFFLFCFYLSSPTLLEMF